MSFEEPGVHSPWQFILKFSQGSVAWFQIRKFSQNLVHLVTIWLFLNSFLLISLWVSVSMSFGEPICVFYVVWGTRGTLPGETFLKRFPGQCIMVPDTTIFTEFGPFSENTAF